MRVGRRSFTACAALCTVAAAASGGTACFLDGEGVPPTPGELNFPAGVVLPGATSTVPARFVVVSNANFDLRYNGGTLLSLDAARIAEAVAACEPAGLDGCLLGSASGFTVPGGEVTTGSFPVGLAASGAGTRLYVPFRSEGTLTYVDLSPETGALTCREEGPGGVCADAHRRGDESIASQRGEAMPGDPSRVLVEPLPAPLRGEMILVLDRGGSVSLFFDDVMGPQRLAPKLIDVQGGLPTAAGALAWDPRTATAYVGSTSQSANPTLARVGVTIDALAGNPERSFLFRAGELRLLGLDDGLDVRDLWFDGERLYVLTRRPEALVVVDFGLRLPGADLPIRSVIDVDAGASRLLRASVGGRTLLFVSCYDGRTVYVVDPDRARVVDVVRGFSGPFAMAVDEARSLLYVTDFRNSTLRVVDLAPLAEGRAEPLRITATIGTPRVAREIR